MVISRVGMIGDSYEFLYRKLFNEPNYELYSGEAERNGWSVYELENTLSNENLDDNLYKESVVEYMITQFIFLKWYLENSNEYEINLSWVLSKKAFDRWKKKNNFYHKKNAADLLKSLDTSVEEITEYMLKKNEKTYTKSSTISDLLQYVSDKYSEVELPAFFNVEDFYRSLYQVYEGLSKVYDCHYSLIDNDFKRYIRGIDSIDFPVELINKSSITDIALDWAVSHEDYKPYKGNQNLFDELSYDSEYFNLKVEVFYRLMIDRYVMRIQMQECDLIKREDLPVPQRYMYKMWQ